MVTDVVTTRPCFVFRFRTLRTLTRGARAAASWGRLNEAPGADLADGRGGGLERALAALGLAEERGGGASGALPARGLAEPWV